MCYAVKICEFCAFQVRRLKEFGVTKGELARYLDALLKDSEQLAAMIDNVSSVDNLDFIMESEALGHTVMDQRQGHESLVAVAGTVTLEEVILNSFLSEWWLFTILSFIVLDQQRCILLTFYSQRICQICMN